APPRPLALNRRAHPRCRRIRPLGRTGGGGRALLPARRHLLRRECVPRLLEGERRPGNPRPAGQPAVRRRPGPDRPVLRARHLRVAPGERGEVSGPPDPARRRTPRRSPRAERRAECLPARRDRLHGRSADEPLPARHLPQLLAVQRRSARLRLPVDRRVHRDQSDERPAVHGAILRAQPLRVPPGECGDRLRSPARAARRGIAQHPAPGPRPPDRPGSRLPHAAGDGRPADDPGDPRDRRQCRGRAGRLQRAGEHGRAEEPEQHRLVRPRRTPRPAGQRRDRRPRRLRRARPGRLLAAPHPHPGHGDLRHRRPGPAPSLRRHQGRDLSCQQRAVARYFRRHQRDQSQPDLLHRRLRPRQRLLQQPHRRLQPLGRRHPV
ncbi:MAG: hypothetical protein AVDCRST_MAG18-395, partial [uncultured Thermomicrobiales bacterium]